MEAFLHETAHYVALAIEAIAITIIAIGAIEAVIGIARVQLRSGVRRREDRRGLIDRTSRAYDRRMGR